MSEITLIGTIGQSVWRSENSGQTWSRGKGLYIESDVRAVVSLGGSDLLLGTESGLCRSHDAGVTWDVVTSFPLAAEVWNLAVSPGPGGSRRAWAGTSPAALFYSDDSGKTWAEAAVRWAATCAGGSLRTRQTSLLSDGPRLWAGVEIDGVQCSSDAGESWTPCSTGLASQDIHALALRSVHGEPRTLFAATNADVCRSRNGGDLWEPLQVGKQFRWPYCRSVVVDPDGAGILVGNGSGPPGDGGAIWRSADGGDTWEEEHLPVRPNSTIWQIVVGAEATWAYSVLGQVYRKPGGGSWQKLPREFGEIRALCVLDQ